MGGSTDKVVETFPSIDSSVERIFRPC